jgi:hypothetical protein
MTEKEAALSMRASNHRAAVHSPPLSSITRGACVQLYSPWAETQSGLFTVHSSVFFSHVLFNSNTRIDASTSLWNAIKMAVRRAGAMGVLPSTNVSAVRRTRREICRLHSLVDIFNGCQLHPLTGAMRRHSDCIW